MTRKRQTPATDHQTPATDHQTPAQTPATDRKAVSVSLRPPHARRYRAGFEFGRGARQIDVDQATLRTLRADPLLIVEEA